MKRIRAVIRILVVILLAINLYYSDYFKFQANDSLEIEEEIGQFYAKIFVFIFIGLYAIYFILQAIYEFRDKLFKNKFLVKTAIVIGVLSGVSMIFRIFKSITVIGISYYIIIYLLLISSVVYLVIKDIEILKEIKKHQVIYK